MIITAKTIPCDYGVILPKKTISISGMEWFDIASGIDAQESIEFSRGHSPSCHADRRTVHGNLTARPGPAIMVEPPAVNFSAAQITAIRKTSKPGPLPYRRKIAVPPEPILETAGAFHAVGDQGLAAVVPFLNQTLAHAKPMALDGRPPVGTNANLRKARNLLCQCLCLRARSPLRGEVFAQADRHAFVSRHLASGKANLERAALPHNARQPHRASIDQRHAPATAIDAEIRPLGHYPKIAPQSQFHAAGDRRPFNRRDDRFVQFQPRGSQRAAGDFAAIAAWPGRRNIELA